MISRFFKNSTPFNYTVVAVFILSFFLIFQLHQPTAGTFWKIIIKILVILFVFGTAFVVNFIVKKNTITKDSAYTVLFYFIFLLFFPSVFNNINLLIANFFILLALRRLISLHSMKSPKEKIFDASLWIFLATIFHFWSVLFLALVFISIVFHVARDYRHWLLPFVAFLAISIMFVFVALVFDKSLIFSFLANTNHSYDFYYFTNINQNIALSLFAPVGVFFLFSMLFNLSNRPMILQSTYKKIIASFFLGLIVFIISNQKTNELLIFTFAPLAIMATSYIENEPARWKKETVLIITFSIGLFAFFLQA